MIILWAVRVPYKMELRKLPVPGDRVSRKPELRRMPLPEAPAASDGRVRFPSATAPSPVPSEKFTPNRWQPIARGNGANAVRSKVQVFLVENTVPGAPPLYIHISEFPLLDVDENEVISELEEEEEEEPELVSPTPPSAARSVSTRGYPPREMQVGHPGHIYINPTRGGAVFTNVDTEPKSVGLV